MSEFGDTAIKLFGRTITPLLEPNRDPSSSSGSAGAGGHGKGTSSSSTSSCSSSLGPDRKSANFQAKSPTDHNLNEDSINYGSKDPQISSDIIEDPKTSTKNSSPKSLKNNGDQESEITTTTTAAAGGTPGRTQEKTTLKKPNKILPCPRCNSTDTKFCYYNNYNVNQPRHFCRKCQRYWTAGGSMRNVPVGAGRRKNKNSANSSNHCLRINPSNNNSSGTILSFGSSSFLVSEVVHDKLHVPVQRKLETLNDHHAGDINKTVDSGSRETKNCQGFLPKQVTFPGTPTPWPCQWNPAVPNANFYPLPFYWGCAVPFMSPPNTSSSSGKRSRDENLNNAEREGKESERNGLVSESLRIDGSDEAAKSSVRSVLGTIPRKWDDKFSLFSGFETKGNNNRDFVSETSLALQANPAAVARSLNFSENM